MPLAAEKRTLRRSTTLYADAKSRDGGPHRPGYDSTRDRCGHPGYVQKYSASRGEDRPDSDVDLLADLSADLSLFGLGRVESDLEAILGARVDLIPAGDLKPGVRARVEPDLVAL